MNNKDMIMEEIQAGEKANIEYKLEVPLKSETYMRTVVAYANANGGRLVFGVENNTWKVVGFAREEVFQIMDAITNAIYDSCEPKITPSIRIQEFNERYIIVVDIPAGMQRPYCIKSQGMIEGVYLRVSGTTRKAAVYQIQEMTLFSRNRQFDTERVERELSEAEIHLFCERLFRHGQELCASEEAKASLRRIGIGQLLSFKVICEENGKYYATNAYQLFDGELKDYPDAVIQCAVFKGKTRDIFISRKEFAGCIDEEIEAAYAFVLEHIDLGARMDGLVRQDIYELPTRTIREMITNAVCHRSYLCPGKVQVALYDDRLEITSPGMLDKDLTIEKMKVGMSKIRNGAIAKIFSYMNMMEAWGTGIPRMFEEAKEYGLLEPELLDMGSDFRINLYRKKPIFDEYGVIAPKINGVMESKANGVIGSEMNDITESKENGVRESKINGIRETIPGVKGIVLDKNEAIPGMNEEVSAAMKMSDGKDSNSSKCLLALIRANGAITQKTIGEKTGLSLSTVKRVIANLQKQGKIVRVGNNRSGKWEIKR